MRLVVVASLAVSFILAGCAPVVEQAALATSSPVSQVTVRVSGSGAVVPLVQKIAEAFSRQNSAIHFQFETGTNSGGAVQGVLKGTLELAAINRPLSDSEIEEPLEYLPFARDPSGFAVHAPASVTGLTTAQVRDIFGGKITDWQQLGGTPGPIVVLDRDEDESIRKLLLVPLLNGNPVRARTVVLTSARDMVSAIDSTPNAVGMTSVGLIGILQPKNVRVLALDGVLPKPDSVASGAYPWTSTFGIVIRQSPPKEVRAFADFVAGSQSSQMLKEYGYAPIGR